MNTTPATAVFFEEAQEQCATLEALLLELNKNPHDDDALGAMFRSAHTIKGSSGLFGFDGIVDFTHVMENVLDRMRKHDLVASDSLIDLLLRCNDYLREVLRESELDVGKAMSIGPQGVPLVEALRAFGSPAIAGGAVPGAVAEAPLTLLSAASEAQASASGDWHLFLRYGEDLFRSGFDPSTFLRYLERLGELRGVFTLLRQPDVISSFDPTDCVLQHEVVLNSSADEARLREAFEFIADDSAIDMLPPHASLSAFKVLAENYGGDPVAHLKRWEKQGFLSADEVRAVLAPAVQQGARPVAVDEPVVERRRAERSDTSRFIRVEAAKMDALINRVGELVIATASSRVHARQSGDSETIQSLEVLSQLVEGIRDDALTLRMVPISEIFNRFPRMVHDVTQRLGKDVELEMVGAETEIDKSMVEKLTDPLMHIVRNAIDHGIEPLEQRLAGGKRGQGRLVLKAYHDTGSVVVDVIDDGRGMDTRKIFARAVENGLVPEGKSMSEQEILGLLFLPGFSTAEKVSDLSGRGVGMDVVKRNIEALRGEVNIITVPGEGSTVRIRLPLTLAIIDGFHVEVGGSAFVLPLDMMSECLDLPEVEMSPDTKQLQLRGEWIPYVSLRELFGFPPAAGAEYVIIVQFGQSTAGIVVDELVGDVQAVIKPLGTMFRSLRGISGSTIMGNGTLALILDVPQIVHLAVKREGRLLHARNERLTRVEARADKLCSDPSGAAGKPQSSS